jgi:hypothetical protein
MTGHTWDAENDRFVRPLHCPQCGAPSPVVPDADREAAFCAFCERPFEIVRVVVGEGEGALPITVARRPQLAYCSVTGERLQHESLLSWAGQNGGAGRTGCVADARGLLFGEPRRDVTWELDLAFSTARLGKDDAARPDEVITSVSVWKGCVVAVTASGLVGLFDPESGQPLLSHAISWPGVDIEDDDHARAIRLPPALRDMTMVLGSDRVVVVRDMAPALGATSTAHAKLFHTFTPPAHQQWIGPPLMAGKDAPVVVLTRGTVGAGGITDAHIDVITGSGPALGTLMTSIPAPSLARPPVWSAALGCVIWPRTDGVVDCLHIDSPSFRHTQTRPSTPLALGVAERPLFLVIDAAAHHGTELWLADDSQGLKVWRATLSSSMADAAGEPPPTTQLRWEPLVDTRSVGALRALAVPAPPRAGTAAASSSASQLIIVTTEHATAAYPRAMKSSASDSVLSRAPIAPSVLLPVGYLSQDRHGLWLRALPPWAILDENPERFLDPGHPETRPAFYDRTFAVVGRRVFFAHAGRVCGANLVPRLSRPPSRTP